jgi:hypothetical protein
MIIRLLLICIFLSGCEYENSEDVRLENVSYSKDLIPIFSNKCSLSGCHVPGAPVGDFLDYEQLKQRIDNGRFNLMIFQYRLMPPPGYNHLMDSEVELIKRWIESGSKNN